MEALRQYSPRRWWVGPLDVEGLALRSVQAAAEAFNLYAGTPGRFSTTPALTAASFDSFGHLLIAGRKPQGFAPLSGFRRTADGWIRLHANYPHHEQRLMQALGANSVEGVERKLRSMASLEAEAAIHERGGIAAAVRTRSEWLATEMGRAAGSGPWVAVEHAGTGTGSRAGAHSLNGLPLAGIRVLDLTRVIAGPVATRLLAALGADVLRIDPPAFPEIQDQFVDTAFGKRSAVLDLGLPANQHRLQELLAVADAVVTGYRHGALDRFGLGPRELLAARPGLVVVTLDSWGSSGPWSRLRGFDSIVQAASGIAHVYGQELYGQKNDDGGWRPGALPVQALDHATGYGVAAAAVHLLAARRQTGMGGAAHLSLARTAEELFSLSNHPEGPENTEISARPETAGNTESPAPRETTDRPGSAVRAENMDRPAELPAPEYRFRDSSFGELRYVGPPLLEAGQPLDYQSPPPPYGSSSPAWR